MSQNRAEHAGFRRRSNRRGHGERLREELLAAGTSLLDDEGDPGLLSLRAVASRAGVAATSVYLQFADLQALKLALAQRCFAELAASRAAVLAKIDDPARYLVVRCQAYVRYALAHPGRYRLMFAADVPVRITGDEAAPSRAAFDGLVGAIARCQRRRTGSDVADPFRLAVLLWTALHGQATMRIDRPDFPWPPMDDLIRELVSRLVGVDA